MSRQGPSVKAVGCLWQRPRDMKRSELGLTVRGCCCSFGLSCCCPPTSQHHGCRVKSWSLGRLLAASPGRKACSWFLIAPWTLIICVFGTYISGIGCSAPKTTSNSKVEVGMCFLERVSHRPPSFCPSADRECTNLHLCFNLHFCLATCSHTQLSFSVSARYPALHPFFFFWHACLPSCACVYPLGAKHSFWGHGMWQPLVLLILPWRRCWKISSCPPDTFSCLISRQRAASRIYRAGREKAVIFCHLHRHRCLWAAASRAAVLTGDTGIYLLVFFPGVETWPGNACFKENVSGNGFSYGNERKAGRQLSGRFGCLPDSGRLSFLCQLSVLHLGQVFPSPSAVVSLVCSNSGSCSQGARLFFSASFDTS